MDLTEQKPKTKKTRLIREAGKAGGSITLSGTPPQLLSLQSLTYTVNKRYSAIDNVKYRCKINWQDETIEITAIPKV